MEGVTREKIATAHGSDTRTFFSSRQRLLRLTWTNCFSPALNLWFGRRCLGKSFKKRVVNIRNQFPRIYRQSWVPKENWWYRARLIPENVTVNWKCTFASAPPPKQTTPRRRSTSIRMQFKGRELLNSGKVHSHSTQFCIAYASLRTQFGRHRFPFILFTKGQFFWYTADKGRKNVYRESTPRVNRQTLHWKRRLSRSRSRANPTSKEKKMMRLKMTSSSIIPSS